MMAHTLGIYVCVNVNGISHEPLVPQQQESLKRIICFCSGRHTEALL